MFTKEKTSGVQLQTPNATCFLLGKPYVVGTITCHCAAFLFYGYRFKAADSFWEWMEILKNAGSVFLFRQFCAILSVAPAMRVRRCGIVYRTGAGTGGVIRDATRKKRGNRSAGRLPCSGFDAGKLQRAAGNGGSGADSHRRNRHCGGRRSNRISRFSNGSLHCDDH